MESTTFHQPLYSDSSHPSQSVYSRGEGEGAIIACLSQKQMAIRRSKAVCPASSNQQKVVGERAGLQNNMHSKTVVVESDMTASKHDTFSIQ